MKSDVKHTQYFCFYKSVFKFFVCSVMNDKTIKKNLTKTKGKQAENFAIKMKVDSPLKVRN